MALFATLRGLRQFEREQLSFIRTIEDLDLVREIGFHQEAGRPLTLSGLFALRLGSPSTVQRRLAHLRAAGALERRRVDRDRRSFVLLLSPRVLAAHERYVALLRSLAAPRRARSPHK